MAEGDVEFGHVVDLTLGEPSGTELVADAAIGATTLTVDYAGDFEDVGEVVLNGAVLPYTSIAYGAAETDPDIITLAAPLAVAALTDDKVVRMAGGEPVADWLLHVSLGDGHPVDIPIPFEQRAMWASVDTSTPVPVFVSADLERLVEVPGREPIIDGASIDASTLDVDSLPPLPPPPPIQTFSADPPSDTTGFDEDHAWWQVDAGGNVLGFWRLVAGAWTAQTITTIEALQANNVLVTALNGTQITGATVQTRPEVDRGIKLLAGEDEDGNPVDAFYVFDNSGVPFIKAVPSEGMAVIAGEVKATTETVTSGASLGGITEITRAPDGTAGAVRLTGYTTAPKSAPIVTTGYDTVQFDDDGLWANRRGWSTDGTYWYTVRLTAASLVRLEQWSSTGALVRSASFDTAPTGATCFAHSGKVYLLMGYGSWEIHRFTAATLVYDDVWGTWTQDDGSLTPALGVDADTSELLIAQSRPSNADKVRVQRYTMPAVDGGPLVAGTSVDTAFAYANDLAGVTYGTHDFGANRYVFTKPETANYRVTDSTGAAVSAEDWQSGMSAKVGFTYTGGAFVSMDTSGLMRTYTGQDKATAIGNAALTKWVSNDLSNATLHTDQSPRAKITIPKRTKLNVTTSAINTGGTNAPDRVRIFVGQGAADPGPSGMWKQTDPAVGVTTTSYSSLATSGTNPVTTNGFAAAAGTVQRVELADGTAFVDGIGNGTVGTGTFRDSVRSALNGSYTESWTAYTPTFTAATTNPTVGNFTRAGRYIQRGKTVHFSIVLTCNTAAGLGTGAYTFGLPVAARHIDEIVVSGAQSTPTKTYVGRNSSGSTSDFALILTSDFTFCNSTTSGMTTGTIIRVHGTYEAA